MGQQESKTHSRQFSRRFSLRDRSFKFHKSKDKAAGMSAAFNVPDDDLQWELLNVNTATEEELMTLPGVNRTLARSIVHYRQTIGGFKKVEDLALVSGVGATRLELFRSEVTVGLRKKNNCESKTPSQHQSMESLPISETGSFRQSSVKPVNINTANVFQLMTVRGIGQELAANIVEYRDKEGQLCSLNDLLRVKTMTRAKLSSIRRNLSVDLPMSNQTETCNSINAHLLNGLGPRTHHRRTKSVPSNMSRSNNADSVFQEVFNILSRQSRRPVIEEAFRNIRNGQRAMRLGNWNLEHLTVEKGKNPGVQEVICRTILENGLSLLVVHEVCPEALNSIVLELNDPVLPKTTAWRDRKGLWDMWVPATSISQEQMFCGLLFNRYHGLQLQESTVLHEQGGIIQVTHILVDNLKFLLAVSYLSDSSRSFIHTIANRLKEKSPEVSSIIIVENSKLNNFSKGFVPKELNGFKEIIPYGTSTVADCQSQCLRIWISNGMEDNFTGHWGVVQDGLSHLAIPKGWTWGGSVSNHYPVWLELFTGGRKSTSTPSTSSEARVLANGSPVLRALQ